MLEVTVIVRSTGHWSAITIAQTTALVVTPTTVYDISPDSAWQIVSYANARPSDYTVLYGQE